MIHREDPVLSVDPLRVGGVAHGRPRADGHQGLAGLLELARGQHVVLERCGGEVVSAQIPAREDEIPVRGK